MRLKNAKDVEIPDSAHTLILCEGISDAVFLWRLLDTHGLSGFSLAWDDDSFSQYERLIGGQRGRTGFKGIKNLLVTADNDSKPDSRFALVCKYLTNAGFTTPGGQEVLEAATPTSPRIGVFMIPAPKERGTLETLLLRACNWTEEKTACIQTFCECVGADKWSNENHYAKMRLRCIIAASCPKHADKSLAWAWSVPGFPVPLKGHGHFDRLMTFLKMAWA